MIIVYGINSLYYDFVGASPISGFDSHFSHFAQGFIALGSFRLSYITFYAAIAVFFVWILWNKTRFGKNIFAIGGNPEAAKVSGVNVALNLLMIYALSGVFYAFGGLLEAGRIGSATNNLGFMYELDAIAACVVGGVSFSGGVGTVLGVVTGVIIFTVINYGLTYIGVNPYWQYIIKGAIIIFAVALDSLKYARKKNNRPLLSRPVHLRGLFFRLFTTARVKAGGGVAVSAWLLAGRCRAHLAQRFARTPVYLNQTTINS